MLFMGIHTYKPEHRTAFIKRGLEKGFVTIEGVKLIGLWTAVGTGKLFSLVETEDPFNLYQMTELYGDLAEYEFIPVMDVQEMLKKLKG